MIWRTLLLGLAMIAAGALGAAAQNRAADQYFHAGAQQYIDEQIQQAKQTVQAGLEAHPADARLRALLKKLEQEREQQQNGGEQSSAQNQQNENRQDGAESGAPSDENERDASADERTQQDPSSENQPEGAQQQNASAGEEGSDENADPSAPRQRGSGSGEEQTDRLTRVQAERILRALENQERQLLREIQRHGRSDRRVEKDW